MYSSFVAYFAHAAVCAAASQATGTSIASSSPAYASRAQSQATPGVQFNTDATGAFQSGQTGVMPQNDPAKAASFGAASTGQPEFPAITTFLATKYGDAYKSASKDASGNVAGQEVLRLLAPIPVDVGVKKATWDLVAGVARCCTGCHAVREVMAPVVRPCESPLPCALQATKER